MRLLRRIHFIPNLVFCQYDFWQIQLFGGFFDALNKTGVSFLVEMRSGRKFGVRFHARKADFYKLFTKFSCEIGRFLLPVGVGALFCLLVGGDALFCLLQRRRGTAKRWMRRAGCRSPVGANCVRPRGFMYFSPLGGRKVPKEAPYKGKTHGFSLIYPFSFACAHARQVAILTHDRKRAMSAARSRSVSRRTGVGEGFCTTF